MKIKRIVLFVMISVLGYTLTASASATSIAKVWGQTITARPGQSVVIPIEINENPGIMGFKILFTYSENIFQSPTAYRGAVTISGMFNNSINDHTNGSFFVLWSDTKDVTSNGPICILSFLVKDDAAPGNYQIKLIASQPDTFNESWKDVKLECEVITVLIVEENQTTSKESTEGTNYANTSAADDQLDTLISTGNPTTDANQDIDLKRIDNEYLVSVVEDALTEVEVQTIGKLSSDQKRIFMRIISEKLSAYGAGTISESEQEQEKILLQLNAAYRHAKAEVFVSEVHARVDDEDIVSIVEAALEHVGTERMKELTDVQKKTFTDEVYKKLKILLSDETVNLDGLSEQEVFTAIEKLYKNALPQLLTPSNSQEKENLWIIVFIGISATIGFFVVLIIIVRATKRKNRENGR